jgi:hypothetical protein
VRHWNGVAGRRAAALAIGVNAGQADSLLGVVKETRPSDLTSHEID